MLECASGCLGGQDGGGAVGSVRLGGVRADIVRPVGGGVLGRVGHGVECMRGFVVTGGEIGRKVVGGVLGCLGIVLEGVQEIGLDLETQCDCFVVDGSGGYASSVRKQVGWIQGRIFRGVECIHDVLDHGLGEPGGIGGVGQYRIKVRVWQWHRFGQGKGGRWVAGNRGSSTAHLQRPRILEDSTRR